MIKQHGILVWAALCIATGIGWSGNQLELSAPGGGEMDMGKNLMKYYASASKPVVVTWDNYILESDYLEYYRSQSVLNGKKRVKLVQSKPVLRTLKSGAIHLELDREFYTATEDVSMLYDNQTTITGGKLEWDQARGTMKLSEKPLIIYQNWKISGNLVEGQMERGLFTVTGEVQALNGEINIRAGKLTFNRVTEEYFLEDHPVLVKGQSQLTATEIIYNVKTQKVSAKGLVQSKMIKEKQ
ncbi:MAG TPA: LptA/OstA family protein [Bacillota bacterium]|nr:LptA/OstA family protein [Bacillota bacterium]